MAVCEKTHGPSLFSRLLPIFHASTPRGVDAVRRLTALGMAFLAVEIPRYSPLIGLHPDQVPLPEYARILCLGRDGRASYPPEGGCIQPGDRVFILHRRGKEAEIRKLLGRRTHVSEHIIAGR